ncbi:DUF4269 domain-containing protein [Romboutsia sp. 1001216sp1]|nr:MULTISPECIES: DUF4269 domain-containing protein [unclassified Romboutsia]MDB8793090.1 DUF4269 domain-containing protein [Romboutsia sp. 1001216sp1]MDB8795883.1 DUF4269 domain-containing protein [Romboutsia sp. 1001216sp1]MDB8799378.1 DUF4269 domain-containing protein [Romboutsia sp. 1001216sp1]
MKIKDINWKDISYLKEGNNTQRKSYEILKRINIFEVLKDYNPILIGTIPIQINIESSDLDIVCEVENFVTFKEVLVNEFEIRKGFKVIENSIENIIVCNFYVDDIEIEIYASKNHSEKTNGYRHMVIEARLIEILGKDFKNKIIALKKRGLKTEPAFAKQLGLKGNPYESLLELEEYYDDDLKNLK